MDITLDCAARGRYYKLLTTSGLSLKAVVALVYDYDPEKLVDYPKGLGSQEIVSAGCKRIIDHINKRHGVMTDDIDETHPTVTIYSERVALERNREKEIGRKFTDEDGEELDAIKEKMADKEIVPDMGRCFLDLARDGKPLSTGDEKTLIFKWDKFTLIAQQLVQNSPMLNPDKRIEPQDAGTQQETHDESRTDENIADVQKTKDDTTDAPNIFAKKGDYWLVKYGGKESIIKNAMGMDYIHHLLKNPGVSVYASQLQQLKVVRRDEMSIKQAMNEGFDFRPTSGEGGVSKEVLREHFKKTILERDKLKRKSNKGIDDTNLLDEYDEIIGEIRDTLTNPSSPTGMNEMNRKRNDAVRKAIDRAIQDIKKNNELLGKHLKDYIDGAALFMYKRVAENPIIWKTE